MSEIESKVQSARRRLMLAQFGRTLSVTLFAALLIATIAIAVPAFYALGIDFSVWSKGWVIGTVVVAVLAALIHTVVKAPTTAKVAAEVDHRFGLRERLSSSISLHESDRESEFGLALQADAGRRASQLSIADKFSLKPSKLGWLPLSIVPILALVLLLVEPVSTTVANSTEQSDPALMKQVQTVAKQLKKRIEQQKRKADAEGLREAKEMYEKMESDLDKLTNKKSLNRKDTMIAMNDLKKQLEERRKELGSSEGVRKALAQMDGLESGEGAKVAKAIQKGEFGKAEDIVKELAKKMNDGKLSNEEKKELQKQVQKMADQLKKAAKKHEQEKQELKEKIEQAKKEGRGADASKMQQQLNQMQQQDAQAQKMGQMAQSMQQAADAMKNGNSQDAADAMQQMADQLGEMSQEMSELEDLESAMDQLSQSKNQMQCQGCQGGGCKQCQGNGMGSGQGAGEGNGLGNGSGKGDRPESENDTNTYETQVRGDVKKGKAIIAGFADGPNRKGVTREDIKAAIQSQLSEESDPTENQSLPRDEREHAQQYFDRLREGT
ncbi:hypothetical protein Pla22_09390 [Rubripirellula amarantea]|uniref:Chromosome partition protein Smc n=1 Tax=Rubripirellula amarantea TaxID=2527999 RepID=A0A5C5WS51_9BACT|nr:hypothetical protein [Rubripirellula amarantea]TWT53310.1 hypothetical protein Pla22_09390 [Rubripirellula amarantea]